MKLNIVLIEPEIPQNTGNIVRTSVAIGAALHLVRPFGFEVTDKALKRAGLDYWHDAEIYYHEGIEEFFSGVADKPFYLLTTKAQKVYSEAAYEDGAFIVFGKETKGLPEPLIDRFYDRALRIPMFNDTRSLNLSNAVAVVAYEALRQDGFRDMKRSGRLTQGAPTLFENKEF